MAIINDELYAEVQRGVAPFLIGNVMDRAKAIIEFCELRSEEEVKGLVGYLNWIGDTHGPALPKVKETLQHDIDGRDDPGMSPRTCSYAQFYRPKAERSEPNVSLKCDNCAWRGPYDNARPAHNIAERIDLGGPYTDVECPDCGALAYPV